MRGRKLETKQPKPVDYAVGQRLRALRMERGMSQEKVGDAAGLTFQQIQKYERGANRIGASRLMQFADILQVNVTRFFEGINGSGEHTDEVSSLYALVSEHPGAISLLRAFSRIEDRHMRTALVRMAQACAAMRDDADDGDTGRD